MLSAEMALGCCAAVGHGPPLTDCVMIIATGGGDEENARRFRPDKGFQGVDYSAAAQAAADGQPVQFERDAPEADPFGLDQFLTDVSADASNDCGTRSTGICRSVVLRV